MKVLITGANGFVGCHLVQQLAALGHEVTGFDIHPHLRHSLPDVTYIQGNITELQLHSSLDFSCFDTVVHLAAAGVKASSREWTSCAQANIAGTQQLLAALTLLPKPPALFCFRTFYEKHLWDEDQPFRDNPYVMTKYIASQIACDWAHQAPERQLFLATVYQAYGPGDAPTNLLSYAAHCFSRGEKAVFGSGSPMRDWVFIDDVVAAVTHCLSQCGTSTGVSEFDIGTGVLTSVRDMVQSLGGIMGIGPAGYVFDSKINRGDEGLRDCATRLPPGWKPKVMAAEGLTKLANSIMRK